jgi:hypothetical protein
LIKIDKREIKACCGKSQKIWKLNVPLNRDFLPIFQQAGFFFLSSFLDAGMLYVEDKGLTATGVFGLNELKIVCKNKSCEDSMKVLEQTILSL